jgi:hypothetical protein
MNAFEVHDLAPEEFVVRVERILIEEGLDEHVSLRLNGNELVTRFRWMGVTELRYQLTPVGDGFRADLAGQNVSLFHAAFRGPFEEHFDHILQRVGARSA